MIKNKKNIFLNFIFSMFLVVSCAYAMDEDDSDLGWRPMKSSNSRKFAKRQIIVSDDEDECVIHACAEKSTDRIVDRDDRGTVATSSVKRKRHERDYVEKFSGKNADSESSYEDSYSESEEGYGTFHQDGYFEKLIAEVKNGEHVDRKALYLALGADQSTVIDCFKKALKEGRLTKEEVRPFYTSREDKNALWDGIVSLIKQKKTKAEIFIFYNERSRRGESFSDGQFWRVLKKFIRENRITTDEAKPFCRSIETKQEILNGIVSRIKERAERTAIFAFYNANCRQNEKLTNNNFNQILKRLVEEGSITHDEAALFTYKAKPIGYQVDIKGLITGFIEEYRLDNDPTSSLKELYDKFAQSGFFPEIGIAENTFREKIRKLVAETGALSDAQLAFVENCKDTKQAYGVATEQFHKKKRRTNNVLPGEFKNDDPKGAVKAFSEEVKSGKYMDRAALIAGTGYAPATVAGLLSDARKEGLLTDAEILRFNTVQQNAFRFQVADLIRDKASETDILAFCQQHEGAREKTEHYLSRNYLIGILQYLYSEGQLTTADTDYLKMEGTVVNRRGETKEYIVQFLNERCKGEPTETRKDLASEFNAFTGHRFGMRPIDVKTFAAHVRELISKKRLTGDQIAFFDSCKEQKQQDGYLPTSKRYH